MPSFDVIIIGAGTNGLACAARLAATGRRVIVLEAAARSGGGALSRELLPGYRVPALAHLLNLLDPRVAGGMNLNAHGLSFVNPQLATTALESTGNHLLCEGAAASALSGNVSAAEQRSWGALRDQLRVFSDLFAALRSKTPPRVAMPGNAEGWELARIMMRLRLMGKARFRDFLRMMLMSVADILDEHLADERLRGLIAFDATLGAWLGPRSPNSLILYLNRLAGEVAGQRGALALPARGMGAVAEAMTRGAISKGATVRTSARVVRLLVEQDRMAGVVLDGGEQIRAPLVASAISPKLTLLNLLGAEHLDTGFVRRLKHVRARGAAAKLHVALKGTPDFRGADLRTRLVIAPSLDAVENSFNPVKYGEIPRFPVMEIVVPSAHEAGHAPEGHHVLSAIVQFAPHAPSGSRDEARATMLERTLATLQDYAPGIRDQLIHAELLMPYDIEASHQMDGGNWHHAELSVEQMLFLRPMAGIAQYSTPMAGLWLAGSGCHPGGGVSGASGWNAAEQIIRQERA